MEDDHDHLNTDDHSPANDNIASALRWIGLIGALALLGLAGAIAFEEGFF